MSGQCLYLGTVDRVGDTPRRATGRQADRRQNREYGRSALPDGLHDHDPLSRSWQESGKERPI